MKTLAKILTKHASLFVCVTALVSYIFPDLFLWVKGHTQTSILGFIMLTMGLTLTANDLRILASRPLDIAIGTMAQFTLMPLIAWSLAHIMGLSPDATIGLILVGCCPGGVSSNLMSYLCHGDVAFSVGMTTSSTLLAPIVTPALVQLLAGEIVDIDAVGMFLNILIVTIVPITIGFGLNAWLGKKEKFSAVREAMPSLSVIGLALIVGGVVSHVKPNLEIGGLSLLLGTFAVVFCHNAIGYALGYTVGRLANFGKAKNRTISIEVGMQNAGLATNLASNFFAAANPLSVVPCAISCAWHSISGTLIANWFAHRDARNEPSKD